MLWSGQHRLKQTGSIGEPAIPIDKSSRCIRATVSLVIPPAA